MNEIKGFVGTSDEDDGSEPPRFDSGSSASSERPARFNGHLLYVHECGNQPKASVEKGDWDRYLFGHEMGDRSRMAYWVNRYRYPYPIVQSADAGGSPPSSETTSLQHPADALEETVSRLCPDGRTRAAKLLKRVGAAILEACGPPRRGKEAESRLEAREYDPRVIYWLRQKFLPELHDYFFDEETRRTAEAAIQERVAVGAGPYVMLAQGMGSIVAYNALRALMEAETEFSFDPDRCRVQVLVTLGSPLGLPAIVKELERRWGDSRKPDLVDEWIDVRNSHVGRVEETVGHAYPVTREAEKPIRAGEDPHSIESYLRSDAVGAIVERHLGMEFCQPVADFRIAKDIAQLAEDAEVGSRHEVLVEFADLDEERAESDQELAGKKQQLEAKLYEIVGEEHRRQAEIAVHRRFVSALLTRAEMERLAAYFKGSNLGWIWRDAPKKTLLHASVKTVQALPARLGYGATGREIAWAVLDTGVDRNHPHFQTYDNLVDQWDCTRNVSAGEEFRDRSDRWDVHGHGTHVAATIAGGLEDVQRQGKPFPIYGMAPETKIYSYKVLADNGNGRDSYIIRALDDIATKNERHGELLIHGVNLSLGGSFDPSVYGCGHSPICRELRRLWRQGVVVCLAAGNEGLLKLDAPGGQIKLNRDLSIADPANLDVAIAVGSSHKANPHTYGVSHFSSRGPTADGRAKPDLVAPGERILSARTMANPASRDVEELYVELSGTSMACPHVSGVLAAFLSQRREFIGYPERVKKILLDNCTDLQRDVYFQGRGMPNLVNMLLHT